MKHLIVILSLTLSACSMVGPGERGVTINFGKADSEVKHEGYYLWIPFIRSTKSISIRVNKTESEADAATKDMQKLTSKVALNWSIDEVKVVDLFNSIGDEDDVKDRIIDPAVSETLKACSAKMTAEEVLTKRFELKKHIDELLITRLKSYNIVVHDISLVNLNFTDQFNHAVEQKQIAEQQAKQAEYDAQKSIQVAKSTMTEAKAQAESQRLVKETITPQLLQLKAIEKWNGQMPTVMSSGQMLFNIPSK